eukprot:TRINITY_DN1871_c0_g4_i2.p1 TRINITY_DN1871_c0_g4~~TRINITY_DN1871_c0_g4_i2.p1  ORF type:complete len:814 (-),score=243.87 TRINITY_DN1871_c0_g4_i2:248-2623(-)
MSWFNNSGKGNWSNDNSANSWNSNASGNSWDNSAGSGNSWDKSGNSGSSWDNSGGSGKNWWNAKGGGKAGQGKQVAPQAQQQQQQQWAQQNAQQLAEKKEADLQAKRAEAETRRAQAVASLQVRKVIQRVRVADSSNIEELCAELEAIHTEKIGQMGPGADAIRAEAESAIEQARARIEKQLEKEAELAKKKIELEVKRKEKLAALEAKKKEDEERVERLGEEAKKLVDEVEAVVEKALESSKALADASGGDDVSVAAAAVEEASATAMESVTAALKSLPEKKKGMGTSEKSIDFKSLTDRLQASKSKLTKMKSDVKVAKEKATRLKAAAKREQLLKDIFSKYDSNCDGKLDSKEIAKLCEVEYSYQPRQEFVSKLLKGADGVSYENFPRLRQYLAIEKSVLQAREKKRQEEEAERLRKEEEAKKEAEFVAAKGEVQKIAEEIRKRLDSNKAALAKAGELEDIDAKMEQVTQAKTCLESVDSMLESISNIGDAESKKLAAYKRTQRGVVDRLISLAKEKTKRLEEATVEAKTDADRKKMTAHDAIRHELALCVLTVMTEKKQTAEELFNTLVSGGSTLGRKEFIDFLRSLPERGVAADSIPENMRADSFDEDAAGALFQHLIGKDEGMSKEKFESLLTRAYFRVSKSTILTEGETLTSKSLQRLDERAVLLAVEGPKTDPENGVVRVKCRKHGSDENAVDGWATMRGNKGTSFLEPCLRFMVCVKETLMTKELGPESDTVRKVPKGEVLAITEWDTVTNGIHRVRCKGNNDDAEGWVTLATNKGTAFLKSC